MARGRSSSTPVPQLGDGALRALHGGENSHPAVAEGNKAGRRGAGTGDELGAVRPGRQQPDRFQFPLLQSCRGNTQIVRNILLDRDIAGIAFPVETGDSIPHIGKRVERGQIQHRPLRQGGGVGGGEQVELVCWRTCGPTSTLTRSLAGMP